MNIIIIPDRHGHDFGRAFLESNITNPKYDKFVFLADWFDSYDMSIEHQVDVFMRDINYHKIAPDKCEYLLGNHDVQYLHLLDYYLNIPQCSGYQAKYKFMIMSLLKSYQNLFKLAIYIDGYVFSHAGLSKTMLNSLNLDTVKISDACDYINQFKPTKIYSSVNNGLSSYSGCLSIRPKFVSNDRINEHQIVGHTYSDEPQYFDGITTLDCQSIFLLNTTTNKITDVLK